MPARKRRRRNLRSPEKALSLSRIYIFLVSSEKITTTTSAAFRKASAGLPPLLDETEKEQSAFSE